MVKVVLETENGNCDNSIREIGRLSNINSAAISYYFGSKDNLILVAIKLL
ncbi:TetR family transcriptional regulator [Mycoplasmatota bacterium]|nr:TetR family transcriptional regulator [Mycoplasmatota bacterium]